MINSCVAFLSIPGMPGLLHLNVLILSTPVLMHGGLICIAVCLSVTGPKFRLENNSYLMKYSG